MGNEVMFEHLIREECELFELSAVSLKDESRRIAFSHENRKVTLSSLKNEFGGKFRIDIFFQNIPSWFKIKTLNSCSSYQNPIRELKQETQGDSLYDCLAKFSKSEQLAEDNMWYCNKCKKHVQAFKSMSIYKTPRCLAIVLKRFRKGT